MVTTRLFAALAILVAVFALLGPRTQFVDLYFHETYIVLSFAHLLLFVALLSAAFAFIYFTAARWSSRPLNNALGITHFTFMALAFFLISFATVKFGGITLQLDGVLFLHVAPVTTEGTEGRLLWPLIALSVGMLSFVAACAAFAVNLGWTAIKAQSQRT